MSFIYISDTPIKDQENVARQLFSEHNINIPSDISVKEFLSVCKNAIQAWDVIKSVNYLIDLDETINDNKYVWPPLARYINIPSILTKLNKLELDYSKILNVILFKNIDDDETKELFDELNITVKRYYQNLLNGHSMEKLEEKADLFYRTIISNGIFQNNVNDETAKFFIERWPFLFYDDAFMHVIDNIEHEPLLSLISDKITGYIIDVSQIKSIVDKNIANGILLALLLLSNMPPEITDDNINQLVHYLYKKDLVRLAGSAISSYYYFRRIPLPADIKQIASKIEEKYIPVNLRAFHVASLEYRDWYNIIMHLESLVKDKSKLQSNLISIAYIDDQLDIVKESSLFEMGPVMWNLFADLKLRVTKAPLVSDITDSYIHIMETILSQEEKWADFLHNPHIYQRFLEYFNLHYNSLSIEDKEMCHLVMYPDTITIDFAIKALLLEKADEIHDLEDLFAALQLTPREELIKIIEDHYWEEFYYGISTLAYITPNDIIEYVIEDDQIKKFPNMSLSLIARLFFLTPNGPKTLQTYASKIIADLAANADALRRIAEDDIDGIEDIRRVIAYLFAYAVYEDEDILTVENIDYCADLFVKYNDTLTGLNDEIKEYVYNLIRPSGYMSL